MSPAGPVPVMPGAEPFAADADDPRIGVVLSHGFTGTTQSMRPWAGALHAAGFSVRLPRLPGHGTRWQDANRTRWQDWYGEIERAHDELAGRCEHVFAMGLSMGGTLVTRLAEQRPVAGLVLVNPSYATERADAKLARYIAWAVPSRPGIASDIKKAGVEELGYDRTPVAAFAQLQKLWVPTLADLGGITAPIRLFRSREDHVVEPLSARLLVRGATSTTVHETVLEDSYHVATLDNDAPLIFSGSIEFVRSIVGVST